MGIEIGKLSKTLVTAADKANGLNIGAMLKRNPNAIFGLGYENLPPNLGRILGLGRDLTDNERKVDGDAWVIGLGEKGNAIDVVRYNPDDRKAKVESYGGTGAYTYMGDAQDGDESPGDDEWVLVRHDRCYEAQIRTNLLIANRYLKPIQSRFPFDWGMIPGAYMRMFPEGVSDRDGNVLDPSRSNDIKAVQITPVGTGTECLVLREVWVGPGPLDWSIPSLQLENVPGGIQPMLVELGINFS